MNTLSDWITNKDNPLGRSKNHVIGINLIN